METNVRKKRMQRLIVAILTMALVLTTFTLMPVASQIANPDSDRGVAYAAAKKVKVTYKANGGKFTAKKYAKKKSYSKKIKKGKKIGALPKIKRSGYTLKGWYTKKSGGKKVSKNTKVKKNTTYYAQWKKKRVLTAEEKKLVGQWVYGTMIPGIWHDLGNGYEQFKGSASYMGAYSFKADGTYQYVYIYSGTILNGYGSEVGTWSIPTSGRLQIKNRVQNYTDTQNPNYSQKNTKHEDKLQYYKYKNNSFGKYGVSIEDDLETVNNPSDVMCFVYAKQ